MPKIKKTDYLSKKYTIMTFFFWLTFFTMVMFVVFNAVSIRKFGMKSCFSEYGKLWGDAVPMHNMNLWSLILALTALFLIPPILQAGKDNPWQFISFLAPIYLFLVVFTPDYQASKKTYIIHGAGALLCAAGMTYWLIGIVHMWLPLVVFSGLFALIGFCARNLLYALIYYIELALFMSVFWALLVY